MDDLISRQAAINKISERQRKLIYCFGFENDMVKIMDIAKSIVIAMPSAQHERKTGEWIAAKYPFSQCSICECYFDTANNIGNFCPNCGSDMGDKQDE